jgi:hypothetical protein
MFVDGLVDGAPGTGVGSGRDGSLGRSGSLPISGMLAVDFERSFSNVPGFAASGLFVDSN